MGHIRGSGHTYVVTSLNGAGEQSLYSTTVTGATWFALSFANGPNI